MSFNRHYDAEAHVVLSALLELNRGELSRFKFFLKFTCIRIDFPAMSYFMLRVFIWNQNNNIVASHL